MKKWPVWGSWLQVLPMKLITRSADLGQPRPCKRVQDLLSFVQLYQKHGDARRNSGDSTTPETSYSHKRGDAGSWPSDFSGTVDALIQSPMSPLTRVGPIAQGCGQNPLVGGLAFCAPRSGDVSRELDVSGER